MGCSSSAPESQRDSGGAGQKKGSQKKTASGKDATPVTQNVVVVDNQGAKIHDSYDIDKKKLGEGSYGTVSICTSKATKQKRAVKALSKTQMKNIEKFKEEIRIMQLMDHPNIIKLYEAFEDKVKVYLVMELCSGGELFDRIIDLGHFTEVQAAIVMQQMFRAVYYMHQRRLCHRGSRKKEKRDAAEIPHSAGVSTEMAEGRAHGMKVGTLCGEAYNDSNNPGSNTRTQRSWLYEPDAALQNIHYGGKKPPVPSKDSELSIPIGEGAMAKVRADLKARQGRLYRVATQITKGNHHRPGISIFQDDVIENPVMYA